MNYTHWIADIKLIKNMHKHKYVFTFSLVELLNSYKIRRPYNSSDAVCQKLQGILKVCPSYPHHIWNISSPYTSRKTELSRTRSFQDLLGFSYSRGFVAGPLCLFMKNLILENNSECCHVRAQRRRRRSVPHHPVLFPDARGLFILLTILFHLFPEKSSVPATS